MKKLIISLLIISLLITLCPFTAWAGCPVNELIYNTLTPVTFSFEKRNGTGEDTANTSNKRIAISYWNGSAVRWWNGTNWDATTEQLLTMTQVVGSQYRYNFTPDTTVSGQFLMVRFDETDDIDVTATCLVYAQPVNRFDDNTNYVRIVDGTGTGEINTSGGNVPITQAFPTYFSSQSIDINGKVLLQPSQPSVVIPTVTDVTNGITLANDAITAAKIASGAIGTSEMGSTAGTITTGSCDPNTVLTFDTTMTEAGVNHWKDAFMTFKDDTTTTELRGQTKVITASAVNGCITVKGGFATTPQSGDSFVIINK